MSANPRRRPLREAMAARREALPAPARIAAADAMAGRLLESGLLPAHGYLAGYWAVRGELPLSALVSRLPPGLVYCLPCIQDGARLAFAPWRRGDPLVANRYGIPEPELAPEAHLAPSALHVALVPLLAFDRCGNRLGSGAGFYDRSFEFRRRGGGGPLLIGVGYGFQQVDALPAARWDVPLDAVVTENECIHCRRTADGDDR
ncbi:MAG TPA: 5-formyltetrahydrofolate cyclo-ligase [Xanthomonadaceae bacterium]|nr:5-formyltetrahydrofolate cyclo-ligase [Xanthomonadaceae bacterium]